jgi:D-3-phosphoglycerate dehydrogenase
VCQRGIGFDNIDIKAASKLGVLVTNAPVEQDFVSVAEHTVALILALAKKLRSIPVLLSREGVSIFYDERVNTMMIKGKTVGIIGLGRIGTRVANLLQPFGVKLLGYDPYIAKDKIKSVGIQPVELEQLLKESDIVTLHVPLTQETYHLIGANELRLMKKQPILSTLLEGE